VAGVCENTGVPPFDSSKEPLAHSGLSLAFRAVHNQGATLQEGWLPFKKSQRGVWIALQAPKGGL